MHRTVESSELEELPLPESCAVVPVQRLRRGERESRNDVVIEETPVALVYNGVSHAVMLASPANLDNLALGFSLSEGILQSPSELYEIEVQPSCEGITVDMTIATARFVALKERRRNLAGRTGCGLCGVESLSALSRGQSVEAVPFNVSAHAIEQALAEMDAQQPLRSQTGAAHGAAWVSAAGHLECVREDVGRHNALDKLVGALAKMPSVEPGFILVTSRASYEMVQKASTAGCSVLAAMSAPTALAIREAQRLNITLAGFVRPGQMVVYSHPERILI